MNTTKKEVKVGLIGVGLNTYWNQFEGLLSRLTDYQRMIKERMSGLQATVIDGGMVDSPEKAAQTAEVLKSEYEATEKPSLASVSLPKAILHKPYK